MIFQPSETWRHWTLFEIHLTIFFQSVKRITVFIFTGFSFQIMNALMLYVYLPQILFRISKWVTEWMNESGLSSISLVTCFLKEAGPSLLLNILKQSSRCQINLVVLFVTTTLKQCIRVISQTFPRLPQGDERLGKNCWGNRHQSYL